MSSATQPATEIHSQSVEAILASQSVAAERGLSSVEAAARLEKYGPNELDDREQRTPLAILIEQFVNPLVWLLLAAAVASVILGDLVETIAILAIVVLNAALGFFQEYRAENALASLRKLSEPYAALRRDGEWKRVAAHEVVPGDIVQLEAGNRVPADGRVIESAHLQINEASLTGESMPVQKQVDVLPTETELAERSNSMYLGTVVSGGRGLAVVTTTGMSTELGRIASMLQGVEKEDTPLQRRLSRLGMQLTWAAVALIALMVVIGFAKGESLRVVVMTALSMAVAVIPEGLPAAVTVVLALGTRRMLERKALIRRLSAIETLGSVTVICTDKTGTLTMGRMSVSQATLANDEVEGIGERRLERDERGRLLPLLAIGSLCNDAPTHEAPAQATNRKSEAAVATPEAGDPTEVAIVEIAERNELNVAELRSQLTRTEEFAFDSDRKRMSTVHRYTQAVADVLRPVVGEVPEGATLICAKGSLESILSICREEWTDTGAQPLNEQAHKAWLARHDKMAAQGVRVLAVAYGVRSEPLRDDVPMEDVEQDLVFLGLLGLSDPPRPEAREAIARCYQAGIRPVMMTGDHPLTAKSIAEQLGLKSPGEPAVGSKLAGLSDEQFTEIATTKSVFARVAPSDKMRVVTVLQGRGEIVGMTGDGVNDAPALQQSTIGIAMGVTGTDVAKDASDVVLLDDNFATIVAAVEEGRIIFGNIVRFLTFLLSSNAGELFTVGIAILLGMPLPLLPLQILWINLVTDGFPALGLAFERSDQHSMERPPRSPSAPLLSRRTIIDIAWIGMLMAVVSLAAGGTWKGPAPEDEDRWRTMIFSVLTLAQLGNALALRSRTHTLWQIGIFTNPLLLVSIVVTSALQLAVVYVPMLQKVFKTVPLSLGDMLLCPVLGAVVYLVLEARKLLFKLQPTGG